MVKVLVAIFSFADKLQHELQHPGLGHNPTWERLASLYVPLIYNIRALGID